MPTVEQCRTLAEEADRLAGIVSYGRDKVRLRQQAETWRVKADALDAERCVRTAPAEPAAHSLAGWLRRRCG